MRHNITSSMSAWATTIGMFVTLLHDGTFVLAGTRSVVEIDIDNETFTPDSHVRRLANRDGAFRRIGATCSPARLSALLATATPDGVRPAQTFTLLEMLEHPVFGANVPTLEAIIAANTEAEEVAA